MKKACVFPGTCRIPGTRGRLTPEQQALAADNRRLVGYVMARMRLPSADADVWEAGALGLCQAAMLWKPAGGCAFSSYACRRIRQRIVDHLRREARRCRRETAEADSGTLVASRETGFAAAENRDLLLRIAQAARTLLPPDEAAVVRGLLQGLAPAAVASSLGIGVGAVYEARRRAAKRLRQAGFEP